MLLLGVLLMAASGTFAGLLIADNLSGGPDYQVTILGNDLATLNSLGVFLAGVGLALVFCLGVALMRPIGAHRRPFLGRARRAVPREAYPERAARVAEPAVPENEETVVTPEEEAAEQGGRAVGRPVAPPAAGRRRHLFGH
ncbi:hypothetical protein ACPC54_21040 [Kitasatospora sp. NPDC094028]